MIRSPQERTRIVRAWLDEGTTEISQQVLDGVLLEFPTTPQDRPFGERWSPRMNTYAKFALATAAVVVAFIAGTRFAPGSGSAGLGSAVSPSPSAIPTPTHSIDYSVPRRGIHRPAPAGRCAEHAGVGRARHQFLVRPATTLQWVGAPVRGRAPDLVPVRQRAVRLDRLPRAAADSRGSRACPRARRRAGGWRATARS